MDKIRLGRTGLRVTRTAFGALPIQRVDFDTAKMLLRKSYENGINFYDTARAYSDSEEKIGCARADVRKDIILATKTGARDASSAADHIEISLKNMKTDYIDILQLHNPNQLPDTEASASTYSALVRAREEGKVRFIGVTSHKLDVAIEAAESGLYDTVQFPLSAISSEEELRLIEICKRNDIGLIAMKALCGGLLSNARMAFAFLRQFDNVVPIWGIQREHELDEFLELDKDPPILDEAMKTEIEKERRELAGDFCRACGYCLPCSVEIPIPMAARMSLLLRRAPTENFLTENWRKNMERIEECTDCGKCRERCPYSLDTPAILKKMLEDYRTFL